MLVVAVARRPLPQAASLPPPPHPLPLLLPPCSHQCCFACVSLAVLLATSLPTAAQAALFAVAGISCLTCICMAVLLDMLPRGTAGHLSFRCPGRCLW